MSEPDVGRVSTAGTISGSSDGRRLLTPVGEYGTDVTVLLRFWSQGDRAAFDRVIQLVFNELRQTARQLMNRENANLTLQPTALVNELWLRLAAGRHDVDWKDRAHFVRICAYLMRQILVDFGRRRGAEKRGAGIKFVAATDYEPGFDESSADLLSLEQTLEQLARHDPRKVKVFELRFWAGLEIAEIAQTLNVSEASVARDWRFIKAFLRKELFSHATVDQ